MNRRLIAVAVMFASLTGCRKRQVEVRTAPPPAASQQQPALIIQVTSTLPQAVNVFITANGNDTFLRQVPANTSESVPVQGFTSGTAVTLKAVTLDGTRTYTRANVVLRGTIVFPLP